MDPFKWLILLACVSHILGLQSQQPHDQHFEKCKFADYQRKFDILPGRGWDNLNNEEMGQILNLNFSKCQFSQDNLYLIPDSVSIIPNKISKVELSSQSFTHFVNYTTVTAQSVNAEAHASFWGASFSASFSSEKEQIKSDQIETKSSTTRVQLRYNVFKSLSEPDAELHPIFRNRLIDIAGLVMENKDSLYPAYLADMIVRDYGTHVIQSIDAGAVLYKIDSLSSSYTHDQQSNSNKISVSAAASFGSIFGMSAKYSNRASQTDIDNYDKNCLKTRINTHGGTLYGANFSLDNWRLSVMDNLVPIDRSGVHLYYMITPQRLRLLDDFTVHKVYTLVKEAVERYYAANVRRGCLDINAPNFNPDANVDARNCESPKVSFNFGGVFQTCNGPDDQCGPARQVNPLTGGYSCPVKYQSVLLHSGLYQCRQYCSGWWIFESCHTSCSYFQTYWCFPTNINDTTSGYRFGGLISNEIKSCPLSYYPLRLGLTAQICVSVNNDPLDTNAIQFGGFYSCVVGNPLAREFVRDKNNKLRASKMMSLEYWPKMCANGYVAHTVSIDQGCQLSYCTETNKVSLGQLPLLIRPPFISLNYNPNSTKVVVFSTAEGKVMVKRQLGNWETDEVKIKEKHLILASVLGTFFTVAFLAILALLYQRRRYNNRANQIQQSEFLNDPSSVTYGSINEGHEDA